MDVSSAPAAANRKPKTYLPDESRQQELVDFANLIQQIEAYLAEHASQAALIAPDGSARPIPAAVFEALEQVAIALANGNGVTVAPSRMLMTTQQAADFLGISRPTLVKLLDRGEIAHELRGRHRRVALKDLVAYQERFRRERHEALDELALSEQLAGLPDGLPTIRRGGESGT